jgi:hypothetical protein
MIIEEGEYSVQEPNGLIHVLPLYSEGSARKLIL